MRRLLGPHLGGQWANKLDILRKWQPRLILLLQPEVDKVKQLREACPQATIIGRFFHDDSHYASNINARPKEFAKEIHNEIVNNPVTPLLDYVQSNNETNQDWAGIQKLNEYSQEWMFLADQSQAYKCAILAFSVGNPDLPNKPGDPAGFDGKMLYWQQVLPSLNYAQANNHILLMHAYGYPNMFAPNADWYIYRYERQVQANLKTLGITKLKYAYGEIGIDRLIVGEKGGYKVVTNDQDYTNQLFQWEKDLQGEDLLLGGAIFTFGDSGGWDTYDITSTNVASMIATHYADHAGDYDASGAADDEGETVFIPAVGTGQPAQSALPPCQWDERLTQRGVTIETPTVAPGQQFWRIVKAQWWNEQESQGRHHIYVEALDESGEPLSGIPARVDWPNGLTGVHTNGRSGFDAGNFPMSKSLNEFSIDIGDGVPSEVLTGIGMGADGNSGVHTSTGVVFQLTTMPAATTPPQPTPEPVYPPFDPTNDENWFSKPKRGYVTNDNVNVRGGPGLDYAIVDTMQQGDPIVADVEVERTGFNWVRVANEGWMADKFIKWEGAQPAPTEPTPSVSGIIDPLTALAFLQVESGNTPFTNGLLTIRFEVHRFKANLKNDALFDKHFKFTPGKYDEQYWRLTPDGEWQHAHGNMVQRHKLLDFASTLNQKAALLSTGMGMAQVMGENHLRIGYKTPQAMFNAFSHKDYGVNAQVFGFVNYVLSDPALFAALRNRDWMASVQKYNGTGQEAMYIQHLEAALDLIEHEVVK